MTNFNQTTQDRLKRLYRQIELFKSDEGGAIVMVFAVAVLLILGMIGGSVDYGRWLSVKSKIVNAMDAAVLAGGRAMQLPGNTVQDAIAAAQKYYEKNKSSSLEVDNTTFNIVNNEIIGTTASTVKTPFLGFGGIKSMPVNATAKAILAAGGTHIEVSMMLDTTGSMGGSKMVDLKAAAKDLIDIVVWADQSEFKSRVALAPFSRYVNVGTTYFNAIAGSTATGDVDQRTCVKERDTADRYTDAAPASGNYFETYSGTGTCKPTTTIMPLSNDKAALKAQIDSMPTTGTTAGHLGTQWAWYLVSPNWTSIWPQSSEPMAYSLTTEISENGKPKLFKIAILMTDGAYNKEYTGDSSTTQARAICTEMKNAGVTVYTVGFGISVNSEPDVTMQQCASTSSHYYNAANGEALKAAFRDIALKISDLRLAE